MWFVWHASFIRVRWLILTCDTTYFYVWHTSPMIWLICDTTHMWHVYDWAQTVRVTRENTCDTHTELPWWSHSRRSCEQIIRDMTHSHVWHDTYVTWLILKYGMTHMWHNSYSCATHTQIGTHKHIQVGLSHRMTDAHQITRSMTSTKSRNCKTYGDARWKQKREKMWENERWLSGGRDKESIRMHSYTAPNSRSFSCGGGGGADMYRYTYISNVYVIHVHVLAEEEGVQVRSRRRGCWLGWLASYAYDIYTYAYTYDGSLLERPQRFTKNLSVYIYVCVYIHLYMYMNNIHMMCIWCGKETDMHAHTRRYIKWGGGDES